MVQKYHAARVILPTEVRLEPRNPLSETYPAILLTREKSTGKYMLPGGRIEGKGRKETAIQELSQELGLRVEKDDLIPVRPFAGETCYHNLYIIRQVRPISSTRKLHLNYEGKPEVMHLGFYDARVNHKNRRRIPRRLVERVVSEGLEGFLARNKGKIRPTKGLVIDGRDYAAFFQHMRQEN